MHAQLRLEENHKGDDQFYSWETENEELCTLEVNSEVGSLWPAIGLQPAIGEANQLTSRNCTSPII